MEVLDQIWNYRNWVYQYLLKWQMGNEQWFYGIQ